MIRRGLERRWKRKKGQVEEKEEQEKKEGGRSQRGEGES